MKNKNKNKRGFAGEVEVPILVLDSLQPIGPQEQLYAIDPLEELPVQQYARQGEERDPLTETRQDYINRVWCDYYNHPPYVSTGLAKYDGKDFSFFSKGENVTDEEFGIALEYCTAKAEMDKLKYDKWKLVPEEDVFYPIDPLPYDDLDLGGPIGLGSGGPGPRFGNEEVHPIDRKDILRSSILPENSDMAPEGALSDMAPEGALMIDVVTPPQPIAPIPQTMDETMTPVGKSTMAVSSYTIENISNELNSKSPIAQAAAEKLATMEQSASKEIQKAEIKVSKNLNPYVIALGVVVGLLIIDKLMMKNATGN
jgi:hypothetical protein